MFVKIPIKSKGIEFRLIVFDCFNKSSNHNKSHKTNKTYYDKKKYNNTKRVIFQCCKPTKSLVTLIFFFYFLIFMYSSILSKFTPCIIVLLLFSIMNTTILVCSICNCCTHLQEPPLAYRLVNG